MNESEQAMVSRFVDSVFHPSDFFPAREAFCHALAIALVRQARLGPPALRSTRLAIEPEGAAT